MHVPSLYFFSFLVFIRFCSSGMENCSKDQSISFSDSEDEVGKVRRDISLKLWIRFLSVWFWGKFLIKTQSTWYIFAFSYNFSLKFSYTYSFKKLGIVKGNSLRILASTRPDRHTFYCFREIMKAKSFLVYLQLVTTNKMWKIYYFFLKQNANIELNFEIH